MSAHAAVRIGVVGYGDGGRWFHTPFIDAADGVELAGVVARSPDKVAMVEREHPGVPIHRSLTEMLAAGVDAVTITTPPATRRELVLEAIAAGVAVVADKPFAPDPEIARELRDAAEAAGVVLAAFHNRRWDADLATVRAVVERGRLGPVTTFGSRLDLVEPHTIPTGVGGGLMGDLGSHLIDQAFSLFGEIESVYAEFDERDARSLGLDQDGMIDAGFFVAATHAPGPDGIRVRSHLTASKVVAEAARTLRVVGMDGTYAASSTDVQARRLSKAGERPVDDPDGWAFEPEPGRLVVRGADTEAVPSERGSYAVFYERFGRAVRGEGAVPVSADDAVHVADVIEAARRSVREGVVVRVG